MEFICSVKALLSEWNLLLLEWPSGIEAVQAIINQVSLKTLRKQSPIGIKNGFCCRMEVLHGIKASHFLHYGFSINKVQGFEILEHGKAKGYVKTKRTTPCYANTHREESASNEKDFSKAQALQNIRTNVIPRNVHLGDYVIVILHLKGGMSYKLNGLGVENS